MKVAALRETHTAGLIPNFTGPVAVAAYQRAVEPGPGDAVVQIHLQHFTSAAFSYFGSVRQAGPGPRDSLIPPVACYPDGAMPAEEKNPAAAESARAWSPSSWKNYPALQQPQYPDCEALEQALAELAELAPLVTSWEIIALREHSPKRPWDGGSCCREATAPSASRSALPSASPTGSKSSSK